MTEEEVLMALAALGLVLLAFFIYITTIERVLERIGFTKSEASTILFLTLFLGWVPIPLFPYGGWWVGLSMGGGLIPVIICLILLKSGRVGLAEASIGVIIVAYVTYFVTRPEEGVGIVADVPLAFAPAVAAGLYALSTYWINSTRVAPLAYFSGVIGTLVGADVFHLNEILDMPPPEGDFVILSIGGANIFDMVYLTGIIAVVLSIFVLYARKQEARRGFGLVVSEFERGAEGLPYAKDIKPAPRVGPDKRGRI